ncbi:MAG TPA: transposase, partial [Rhabdochlamydiaceae bacterium]
LQGLPRRTGKWGFGRRSKEDALIMKIVRTYKYRAYLSPDQIKTLDRWFLLCRKLYNLCVEQRKSMYLRYNECSVSSYEKDGEVKTSYSPRKYTSSFEQQKELTLLRSEFPEFKEVACHLEQKIVDRVDQAFKKFYDNIKNYRSGKINDWPKEPKFKPWFKDFSLLCKEATKFKLQILSNSKEPMARIYGIPSPRGHKDCPIKKGIKVRYHKSIDGKVLQQLIKKEGQNWFLCVSVEKESADINPSPNTVGIDLGIARTAQLSDGQYRDLPYELLEELYERKKVLQRRLRNKKGGNRNKKEKQSKNYKRAYQRIAKIDRRIANIKAYHLKMVATEIARNNSVVVVEKLNVKNMTKSAKGTVKDPGKKVKQKSGLNRKILLTNPSFFRGFLKQKCQEFGSVYIEVNPAYTSQTCSKCSHVDKGSRLDQEHFECTKCGFELNADHNAAINILNKGLIK